MLGLEIKVGVSVSLSGKFHLHGRQALNGILLWQRHANGAGGISLADTRRPIRVLWYDDASRASRVQENVLRLLGDDQVDILLGPYSSSLTMAAADAAAGSKKLVWDYGGTSDGIFDRGWRHVMGVASPASDYLRGLPQWLSKECPELRRILILYAARGSFASQVARGILESGQDTGHSVDLLPLRLDSAFNEPNRSFCELFEREPEAVVLAANFEDELRALATRPRWPKTVRTVAAVAAGITEFRTRLGPLAEGVIGPSQWEPGVNLPSILGPHSEQFVDQFEKQFGIAPDYVAAGSFASGLILAECIHRADSLEDEKLRRVASSLDCNTFYGRFRIDSESGRQIGHQILLVRWHNDRKEVLSYG